MRVGQGYDIHRLKKGKKLLLGGIEIPAPFGETGHSDGDVLMHAMIDAMLGGAALGDIGTFFPPGEKKYKNISSRLLLKEACILVEKSGYKISNVDATVILEKPEIKAFIPAIRNCIAKDLKIMIDNVSVKAKTKEGLGPVGRSKAIEAHAVVMLINI
jgi:2-C-methyl-D-erythritol 2,4-cyclodiphosphate synthase